MSGEVFLGVAADPKTKVCDWCGEAGVKAIELTRNAKKIGTGQFLYPCSKHIAVAERMAHAFGAPKTGKGSK